MFGGKAWLFDGEPPVSKVKVGRKAKEWEAGKAVTKSLEDGPRSLELNAMVLAACCQIT
jgi:hypothetical protein